MYNHNIQNIGASEAMTEQTTEVKSLIQSLDQLNELAILFGEAESEDEIFKLVARHLGDIVPGDRASVSILNDAGNQLEVFALDGMKGILPTGTHLPVKGTATGCTVEEKRVVIEPEAEKSRFKDANALGKQGIRTTISVPLFVSQEVIGTLNSASKTTNSYGKNEEQLVLLAAAFLSRALETQRRVQQERLLRQASLRLMASTSFEEILQAMAITEAGKMPDTCYLYAVEVDQHNDPEWLINMARWHQDQIGSPPPFPVGHQTYWSEHKMSRLITEVSDGVLLIEDVQNDKRVLENMDSLLEETAAGAMAVITLKLGARWIGLARFEWSTPRRFTETDARFYRSSGTQAAVLMNNQLLLEQLQQRANREQAIRQVTEKIRSATSMDHLLDIATQELAQRLSATHVRLDLGLEKSLSTSTGNGSPTLSEGE